MSERFSARLTVGDPSSSLWITGLRKPGLGKPGLGKPGLGKAALPQGSAGWFHTVSQQNKDGNLEAKLINKFTSELADSSTRIRRLSQAWISK